jgi:cytochrome d ubiquinol oxidase subunit I
MVGLGVLMLALGLWSLWLRWKSDLLASKAFLRFALWMGPAGLIAILAGWITTEAGRQPWVVYNVMRTAAGVSNHSVLALSISLIVFIVLYCLVFGVGIGYMLRIVARGPEEEGGPPAAPEENPLHRPARPISAAGNDINAPPIPTAPGN